MSTEDPRRAQARPALTPLPRIEELPTADQGFDRTRVQEAFDAFRRHVTSLQTQLRVLQAAPRSAVRALRPCGPDGRPSPHPVGCGLRRHDRARCPGGCRQAGGQGRAGDPRVADGAADPAGRDRAHPPGDGATAGRDPQRRAQRGPRHPDEGESRVDGRAARESESKGARLIEQSRHQATELTNSARAEVEQTLEWARAQADVIVQRARMGAEQLLSAAGHGEGAIQEAIEAIVRRAEETVEASRRVGQPSTAPPPRAVPTGPSVPNEPGASPNRAPCIAGRRRRHLPR